MQQIARQLRLSAFKPSPSLPSDCNPIDLEYPRLAYWGIGLKGEELTNYANKLGLYHEDRRDPYGGCFLESWMLATEHLSKKLDYKLKLRFPISPEYNLVLGLYSNINVWDGNFVCLYSEDEKDLLCEIQEELGIDTPSMWHYDQQEDYIRIKPWREIGTDKNEQPKQTIIVEGGIKADAVQN